MLIQMIWTSENNCLFIYGFNDKGELLFRSSKNIKHLQHEIITIKNGLVHTNMYFFPKHFIQRFIN